MKKRIVSLLWKRILGGVLLVAVIAALTAVAFHSFDAYAPDSSLNAPPVQGNDEPDAPKVITVAAMGDMLAHDTIIKHAKSANGYDFAPYFTNIKSAYADASLVICNQEGPSAGPDYGISGYPTFNAPIEFSKGLSEGARCNIIGLANNHMGDKGAGGISATLDTWESLNPLAVSGANRSKAEQQQSVKYFERDGIKFAFVAFADFNNNAGTSSYGVNNYHDRNLVTDLVTRARKNADVVIVGMHWGVEDSNQISSDQEKQVDILSQLGVDVVIGTGPHVLQPVDVVKRPDGKEMTVWYSLGNMLSSQLKFEELVGGIALFDITQDESGVTIGNMRFVPTYMHYEWTAEEKASDNLLARRNVALYRLKDASGPLSRSLFNETIDSTLRYVKDILGPKVRVIE